MLCQVKTSVQCQLRDKKQQNFSIVSLPTHSVIVDDHRVYSNYLFQPYLRKCSKQFCFRLCYLLVYYLLNGKPGPNF
jgi:hypothetical protein